LDQVEHAVAAPDLLPQVRGGEVRGARLVPGAAVLAAVEWKKPGLRPLQFGRNVDQVRVNGEVTKAAAELKERFLRVAVVLVLRDGVDDGLAGERVLQLRGEDRQSIQEQ